MENTPSIKIGEGKDRYDPAEFVIAYFHGDVDLHNIFRKLGKDLVLKIVSEI